MITDAHLLTIRRFIAAKAQIAAPSFKVFTSGIDYTGKEAFWSNTGANKTTQKDLETSLINAIWVEWLNFTDTPNNPNVTDAGEDHAPIITRIYQLTVFCEANNARYNESGDLLDKRFLSVDRLIELTINELVTEFRGATPIDLSEIDETKFVISESNSLYMQEYVERNAVCDFIPNKTGRQAKLIVPVLLQLLEC